MTPKTSSETQPNFSARDASGVTNRECKSCGAFKAERDAACTFCGLAPTAPVEASGSEREYIDGAFEEAVRLAEVGEFLIDAKGFAAGNGYDEPRELSISWDWQQSKPDEYGMGVLLAEATRWHDGLADDGHISAARKLRAALRPQPSGETREDAEVLAMLDDYADRHIGAARVEDMSLEEMLISKARERLSARPLALGGQQGEATDDLVDRFAVALKAKLRAAGEKYGFDDAWKADDWRDKLIEDLWRHVQKGDPRDVAAYCAFAWHHGWAVSDTEGWSNEDLETLISDALDDSLDMDWTSRDGAKAVLRAFKNEGLLPGGQTALETVRRVTHPASGYSSDDAARRAAFTASNAALSGLTPAEQKTQAARCGCKGSDDMCPCQNTPDRQTIKDRSNA